MAMANGGSEAVSRKAVNILSTGALQITNPSGVSHSVAICSNSFLLKLIAIDLVCYYLVAN